MSIERGSGNIAIESYIIGREAREWKHQFVKNEAVPCCDLNNKIIKSPMFGTIINDKEDTIVRGKNEHEAGHARLTPMNKKPEWSALKGNVINALEDLRIEKSISKLADCIKDDLKFLNQEIMSDINRKMLIGDMQIKPLDEAIMAMMMTESGISVSWELSEKAKRYFDNAYPVFATWKDINNPDNKDGFFEIEKIADAVIEKFKEVISNDNQQNKSEKDDKKSEKDDNQEKNSDNKNQESTSDDEDNEEGGNSSSSEEDGENGNGHSSEEDEKENNSDVNGNNQNDGENDNQNCGNKSESSKNENGQKDSTDSDMNRNNTNGSDEVGDENDDIKSNQNHQHKSEKDDKKSENKKSKEDIEKELEKDFGNNQVKEKTLKEKLQKIMEKSKEISDDYTAYTGEDEIIKAEKDKEGYETARKQISATIAQLANYTEDALKAMSRVAYQRNLERGKIDSRKLVGLSKSLTRKVFYKTTDGIDLNVAVTVMIDESGSIGYMCHQLRSLAIAFSEVFEKLNIKFEVIGFTTAWNRSRLGENSGAIRVVPMKIYEHKNFNEPYPVAKYKLGSINSYNCNIDGETLLLAFKRINQQKVNRRIIFVLSDGMPNQGYNSRALYRHLNDSIKFVRMNGTEVYGFGIGTNEPEKFYGKDNFVYLEDIGKLGSSFFNRFREIVAKR